MNFRTELHLPPSIFNIQYHDMILLLGSCFTDNIGDRLQKYKFKCISNPFGTIFNPISISRLISYVDENRVFSEFELQVSQGVYVHHDFHSSLGDIDPARVIQNINLELSQLRARLHSINYVFITLGTSVAYKLESNQNWVANCHKLPSSMFSKNEISIQEGVNYLSNTIEILKSYNKDIKVIFTVSPVRHIKDGLVENNRSKARLILMIDELEKSFSDVYYFPAYEWLNDDLRDYRFYGNDLLHPNEAAIDYIWDKFKHHYFAPITLDTFHKIENILNLCAHRPFNPLTIQHKIVMENTKRKIDDLLQIVPGLNFELEIKQILEYL